VEDLPVELDERMSALIHAVRDGEAGSSDLVAFACDLLIAGSDSTVALQLATEPFGVDLRLAEGYFADLAREFGRGEVFAGFGLPPAWVSIATDLSRTTGFVLDLRDSLDRDHPRGFIEVRIDNGLCGGFTFWWDPDEPGAAVAQLADRLCEFTLHETVWGGWPICPLHRTHPLEPGVRDGLAMWVCPERQFMTRIGDLQTIG
jgi:hypothetical protein